MSAHAHSIRAIIAILALWLAAGSVSHAQERAIGEPWQVAITAQIQAFRDRDAPTAFSFAGAGFQTAFPTAEAFFESIVRSGYAPIAASLSHSFGSFERVGDTGVVQGVRFIAPDQSIYGALYQMTEEEAGWRVQGVQLFRQDGVAI